MEVLGHPAAHRNASCCRRVVVVHDLLPSAENLRLRTLRLVTNDREDCLKLSLGNRLRVEEHSVARNSVCHGRIARQLHDAAKGVDAVRHAPVNRQAVNQV